MKKLFLILLLVAQGAAAQALDLTAFESQMKDFGKKHCAALKDPAISFDSKLAATYYDAELVFFNIGDYTKDTSWYDCAHAAQAVYRDLYVVPNQGKVPGYWNFSHGLTVDALRTGDAQSRAAEISLATNAAFASDTTPLIATVNATLSREVAYAVMAYLNAESLGEPKRTRLPLLVDQAFGHLDQWFKSKTASYIRPFMVSLTAHALISYNEKYPDARTLPALQLAADSMWKDLWLPDKQSFKYTSVDTSKFAAGADSVNTGGLEPSPDLNLLIAPLYGWLYMQTKDVKYKEEGDQIFTGGVKQAWLVNGKQFNQNYRLSFKYLDWRNGVIKNPTPVPGPVNMPTAIAVVNPCEKSPPPGSLACTNYLLRSIRDLLNSVQSSLPPTP